MTQIHHPIAVGTLVEANKPQCPCKGSAFAKVSGRIGKVIVNQTGHWYYLDTGHTISAQWVTKII